MHAFSAPKTLDNLTVFCFQGVEKRCTGNEWVNGKFIWLFSNKADITNINSAKSARTLL